MSQTMSSTLKGQCIAEFLGTGLIIFFGAGCVAALKLAGAAFGQWEMSIVWGFGVAMAIYLTAAISGAHLSPAVTVALCLFANFEGRKVLPYIIAQVAGAFCAAALVYGLYYNLFFDFEQSHNMVRGSVESLDLAGIFSTYPNPHISVLQAFLVETVITAILIAVIGASMGPLTGFALNPARVFGPKVFAYFAGWGKVAFTGARDIPYFLVPIFGPLIGASLGAFGYKALIGRHLPYEIHEAEEEALQQPAKQRKA